MEYKYRYKVEASDLWQFRMYYAYSSYLCIINIICIISSIALLVELWDNSPGWFRGILIVFFMLFTVIQPSSIYLRAKKEVKAYNDEIELHFNDEGLSVTVNGESQHKKWNEILQITIKPTMIVVYTDREHGYILTTRVYKDDKKEFVKFMKSKRAHR